MVLPQYGHGINIEIMAAIKAQIKSKPERFGLSTNSRAKPVTKETQKMILTFLYLIKASRFNLTSINYKVPLCSPNGRAQRRG